MALLAVGCTPTSGGGGGNGGAGGDGGTADMGATDAAAEADLGLRDSAARFCDALAEAKCEYAFACVGGGAIHTKLGLSGPTHEDCVAADSEECKADVLDRFDRGTLDLTPAAVDTCVSRVGPRDAMGEFQCPPGDPTDWVEQWRRNIWNVCGPAIRGTQVEGDMCVTRNDCAAPANPSHICKLGTCAESSPSDSMVPCNAEGSLIGELNYDPLCAGQSCAAVGPNEEGIEGICTTDCSDGAHRCPQGAPCLQISVQGASPSWLCTATCTEDDHCSNGFVCRKIDPMAIAPDAPRHCFVTSEQ